MNNFKIVICILALIFNSSANAELICKGKGFGLLATYTFSASKSKDLSIHIKTILDGKVDADYKGIAKYQSTSITNLFGKVYRGESYYVFSPDKDSFSELIAIDDDLLSMARSRPMSSSSTGNFIKFSCLGLL